MNEIIKHLSWKLITFYLKNLCRTVAGMTVAEILTDDSLWNLQKWFFCTQPPRKRLSCPSRATCTELVLTDRAQLVQPRRCGLSGCIAVRLFFAGPESSAGSCAPWGAAGAAPRCAQLVQTGSNRFPPVPAHGTEPPARLVDTSGNAVLRKSKTCPGSEEKRARCSPGAARWGRAVPLVQGRAPRGVHGGAGRAQSRCRGSPQPLPGLCAAGRHGSLRRKGGGQPQKKGQGGDEGEVFYFFVLVSHHPMTF